ncbi:protein AAR2 homolog isoform X1 [Acanthopagrus latus]|uniref:protein AAR2 homolog isoform X1 n=2 Tax=Acanthopagrus latus TaxID=8177 RepID=UPI00187CD15E|nr:protein AAR2 homolog isoform X1 [Acanthopagrus latus]
MMHSLDQTISRRYEKSTTSTTSVSQAAPDRADMAGSRSVVDMDPDVARRLFEEGAFLVLLGVPQGTELGIDCKSWQVGPRFKGVKMIPPGIHFLHYCSANPPSCGGEIGPKTGLFLTLKPREILLANWDPKTEDLDFSASQNEEEVSRIRASLRDLDPFLGPYPYEVMRKWVSLTDRLSQEVASSLQPLSGRVCAFSDVVPVVDFRHTKDREEQPRNDTACQSMKEGLDRLPRMKHREGTELRFSTIPEKNYPPGATPAEITQCSMDLSYALETVLEKNHRLQPLNLLGELQFAFVCFLIGNVYEGFEHWKRLLVLLCRAEEAMRERKELYLGLIAVLYHQLGEIPPDFFVDIVSQDNFLTSTLQDFFQFASGPGVDGTLRKRAEKFKAHLTKKFRWDFDADLDDCAPVVVELPEGVTID